MQSESLDLVACVKVLRRRWPAVAVAVVICVAGALLVSLSTEPTYEGSLVFSVGTTDSPGGGRPSFVEAPSAIARLCKADSFRDSLEKALSSGQSAPIQVEKMSARFDGSLVFLSAASADRESIPRILETAFSLVRSQIDTPCRKKSAVLERRAKTVREEIALVRDMSAQDASHLLLLKHLEDMLDGLEQDLSSVQESRVIAGPSASPEPVGPSVPVVVLAGLAIGLFLGLALVWVMECASGNPGECRG